MTRSVLWAWLSRTWDSWSNALVFVQPSTVTAWQRRRFRDHWARLSRTIANPRWGAPRIVGELAKLARRTFGPRTRPLHPFLASNVICTRWCFRDGQVFTRDVVHDVQPGQEGKQ